MDYPTLAALAILFVGGAVLALQSLHAFKKELTYVGWLAAVCSFSLFSMGLMLSVLSIGARF